ncbi:MAG: peptidoglycan DD-metalloendopeptidase family protein [Rhodovibrionaceae bacterium]
MWKRWSLLLCGGALSAALCHAPALAQTQLAQTEGGLEERKQELGREAEALQAEIASLREAAIGTARNAQDLESELTRIEGRLSALEREEETKRGQLSEQREKLAQLLAALQRLALQPPESLLMTPGAPLEHVRSAMLLGIAVPEIEERAAALRDELEALATLREDIERQRSALARRAEELDSERARLESIVAEKQDLESGLRSQSAEIAERLNDLAERAETVDTLIVELDKQTAETFSARPTPRPNELQQAALPPVPQENAEARPPEGEDGDARETMSAPQPQIALARPSDIRSFPESPGGLLTPVRGSLSLGFGGHRENGETSQGILLSARPAAQVVAPYDGKVAYAGQFRRYGLILIIEHDGRYHSLLAGLDRIDAIVGQWVLAGEPVGVMTSRQGRNPELYLELRRAGKPVDPLPWIENLNSKAEG